MTDWYDPEQVELRLDEEGHKRWYLSTRDGWVLAGHNGKTLELSVEHFSIGTRIELKEPVDISILMVYTDSINRGHN